MKSKRVRYKDARYSMVFFPASASFPVAWQEQINQFQKEFEKQFVVPVVGTFESGKQSAD